MTASRQNITSAASFGALGTDPALAAEAALGEAAPVQGPTGAMVFASGALGQRPAELLGALRERLGPIPMLLAVAPGVLTDRAEHEGKSAVAGLVFRGGTASTLGVQPDTHADKKGEDIARQIDEALDGAPGTAILFADPRNFSHRVLDALSSRAPRVAVVGGGTLPGGAYFAAADGSPKQGALAAMVLRGLSRPAMRAASAVRPLAPLAAITEAKGSMVLAMDGKPALDALSRATQELRSRPLVLALLSRGDGAELLVRGIRGVDPSRGGVVVTDEVATGMRMGFGVCDGAAACTDFENNARDLARQLSGAAPQFGLLMTCAGRGAALYGTPDVETRLLRGRFPKVPFSGMFSAFEIGPAGGRPSLHMYTGVVAMFGTPS
jgi:small ligand-binding sensory domain FIST